VFAAEREWDAVDGPALAEDIQEALDEVSFPVGLVDQLTRRLEARGLRHSLDPDQLASEVSADFFAVYTLWRATVAVMEHDAGTRRRNYLARPGLPVGSRRRGRALRSAAR
jgi:hypothetical protein